MILSPFLFKSKEPVLFVSMKNPTLYVKGILDTLKELVESQNFSVEEAVSVGNSSLLRSEHDAYLDFRFSLSSDKEIIITSPNLIDG